MFFCNHQSVQQSISTSLRFKVIPSCITLSGVNLKFNCILDRHVPLSFPSLVDQLPFTSFPRLVCKNPRSIRTRFSPLLFSIPRSDRCHFPPPHNRVKYEKNGTTKRRCSRESFERNGLFYEIHFDANERD